VRKSLFFSFLPRKAFCQAWSRASLASFSLDFLPQLKPLVYLRIFSLFLWAVVPLFTLVMFFYKSATICLLSDEDKVDKFLLLRIALGLFLDLK